LPSDKEKEKEERKREGVLPGRNISFRDGFHSSITLNGIINVIINTG